MYNLLINDEFIDYLAANGYSVSHSYDGKTITCSDRERSVEIYNDKATFSIWYHGSDDEEADFSEYGSVSGINQLDYLKWTLLLHAFDVVPIRRFMKNAGVKGDDLFSEMIKILAPAHLPECY